MNMKNFYNYLDNISQSKINTMFLFCIAFMFCDHLGAYFYPDVRVLRVVGRIGLFMWPVMFYVGISKTSDRLKYMQSVFLICCITQVVWFFMFPHYYIVDLFILLASIFLITFYDSINKKNVFHNYIFMTTFFSILFYVLTVQPSSIVFLLIPICLYYRLTRSLFFILSLYFISDPFQLNALLGIPFLFLCPAIKFNLPKIIKYSVYPAHYFIILVLLGM